MIKTIIKQLLCFHVWQHHIIKPHLEYGGITNYWGSHGYIIDFQFRNGLKCHKCGKTC